MTDRSVREALPGLSPSLPYADLAARTRAGTDCGTCRSAVVPLLSEAGDAFHAAAKRIHAFDRNLVFFMDVPVVLEAPVEAGLATALRDGMKTLSHHTRRFYPVLSLDGGLEDARRIAPLLTGAELFALAVDRGRELFVNEEGLEASAWIAALRSEKAFPAWTQINKGRFKRWNPEKNGPKALLRFLMSEITYAREALDAKPLRSVIAAGTADSEIASVPKEWGKIPIRGVPFDGAFGANLDEILNVAFSSAQ